MQVAVFYDPLICPFTGRCRFGHITEHWGKTYVPKRVYVHPKPVVAVFKALAQRVPYTRSSLPETQSKGIGWA